MQPKIFLWGPPGSGKTWLWIAFIKKLFIMNGQLHQSWQINVSEKNANGTPVFLPSLAPTLTEEYKQFDVTLFDIKNDLTNSFELHLYDSPGVFTIGRPDLISPEQKSSLTVHNVQSQMFRDTFILALNPGSITVDEFIEALQILQTVIQDKRRRVLACLTKADELNPSRDMLENVPMLIRARFGIEAGEKITHLLTQGMLKDGHEVQLFATSAVGYTRKEGMWVPNISHDNSQLFDERNWFPIGVEKPFLALFEIMADKKIESEDDFLTLFSRLIGNFLSPSSRKEHFHYGELLQLADKQLPVGFLENQYINDVQIFFDEAGFSMESITPEFLTIENTNRQPWIDIGSVVVGILAKDQIDPKDIDDMAKINHQLGLSGIFSILIHQGALKEETIFRLWELKLEGYVIAPIHILSIKNAMISYYPNEEIRLLENSLDKWRLTRNPFESTKGRYDPQWVVGLDNLLDAVMEHIESNGAPFMLWGMRRSGKTVAMNQILFRCRANRMPVFKWICEPDISVDSIMFKIVNELSESVARLYPEIDINKIKERLSSHDDARERFDDYIQDIIDLLELNGYSSRMVILLDQFDLNLIVPSERSNKEFVKRYSEITRVLLRIIENVDTMNIVIGVAAEYQWADEINRMDELAKIPNPLYRRFSRKLKVFPIPTGDPSKLLRRYGALGGITFSPNSISQILHETNSHPEIMLNLSSCIWHVLIKHDDRRVSTKMVSESIEYFLNDINAASYRNYFEEMFWNNFYSNNLDDERIITMILAQENSPCSKDTIYTEFQNEYMHDTDVDAVDFKKKFDNTFDRLAQVGFIIEENHLFRLFSPLYARWVKNECLSLEFEMRG